MKEIREIHLPPNVNEGEKTCICNNKSSIILVGANGSGKTRMSLWIEDEIRKKIKEPGYSGIKDVRRISAQKSLNIPESITMTDIDKAHQKLVYGQNSDNINYLENNRENSFWGKSRATHLLDDYGLLMTYLMSEHNSISNKQREQNRRGRSINLNVAEKTKLEQIIDIWEQVVLHRHLFPSHIGVDANDSDAVDDSQQYSARELSDGEREIFYFIGEVVCVEPDSLIIIDEPENHLHSSILMRLWETLEAKRSDCKFLYITHNLDFAYGKKSNADIIWVKGMQKIGIWDYRFVKDSEHDDLPEQLRLEVMGSRQKVLIVEGNGNRRSFDKRLYSLIYPDYNVIQLGGCDEVRRVVSAYNEEGTSELHYKEVKGIIDRDRMNEDIIARYASQKLYVPDVAIAENLFVCPDIIRVIARNPIRPYNGDVEELCTDVKNRVIACLAKHKEEFALLYLKDAANKKVHEAFCATNLKDLKTKICQIPSEIDMDETYDGIMKKIDTVIQNSDLMEALKIINDKDLIADTKLPQAFGFDSKGYGNKIEKKKKEDTQDYIDFVINMLASEKIGAQLRDAFRKHFNMTD